MCVIPGCWCWCVHSGRYMPFAITARGIPEGTMCNRMAFDLHCLCTILSNYIGRHVHVNYMRRIPLIRENKEKRVWGKSRNTNNLQYVRKYNLYMTLKTGSRSIVSFRLIIIFFLTCHYIIFILNERFKMKKKFKFNFCLCKSETCHSVAVLTRNLYYSEIFSCPCKHTLCKNACAVTGECAGRKSKSSS